jgi:hypothetical protein
MLLCKLIGHGCVCKEFIDSHDNWDGMNECPHCGLLDPDFPWWQKILKKVKKAFGK